VGLLGLLWTGLQGCAKEERITLSDNEFSKFQTQAALVWEGISAYASRLHSLFMERVQTTSEMKEEGENGRQV
jgi:hypothetical protein